MLQLIHHGRRCYEAEICTILLLLRRYPFLKRILDRILNQMCIIYVWSMIVLFFSPNNAIVGDLLELGTVESDGENEEEEEEALGRSRTSSEPLDVARSQKGAGSDSSSLSNSSSSGCESEPICSFTNPYVHTPRNLKALTQGARGVLPAAGTKGEPTSEATVEGKAHRYDYLETCL